MQDRFKFRIWDKDKKKMFDCIQINFTENAYGSNKIKDNECSIHLMYQPHLELIQCTGLKDKNGKLIFEGHIVKDDHEALHQVKWCYNCFLLKPCFENGYTLGIVDDEIEIIGNIYENPELIGGAEC